MAVGAVLKGVGSALAAPVGAAIGAFAGRRQQGRQHEHERQQADIAYGRQRDAESRQHGREDTTIQRMVQDAREAGINPKFMLGQGGEAGAMMNAQMGGASPADFGGYAKAGAAAGASSFEGILASAQAAHYRGLETRQDDMHDVNKTKAAQDIARGSVGIAEALQSLQKGTLDIQVLEESIKKLRQELQHNLNDEQRRSRLHGLEVARLTHNLSSLIPGLHENAHVGKFGNALQVITSQLGKSPAELRDQIIDTAVEYFPVLGELREGGNPAFRRIRNWLEEAIEHDKNLIRSDIERFNNLRDRASQFFQRSGSRIRESFRNRGSAYGSDY